MGNRAKKRKEEEYKRALARIIEQDTRDERFSFATITEVELSQDLKYAEVYVDVIGDEEEKEASVVKLNEEEGFFRTSLAHRVDPRFTPELTFKLDRGLERMQKIEKILKRETDGNEENSPEK